MIAWQKSKMWADGVNNEVKRLLGQTLIHISGENDDAENNTDFMVFPHFRRGDACRIAVRVRNHKFYESYKHEFTIRSVRTSGVKTELDKILDGKGDYMFYGFMTEKEDGIIGYTIFDLQKFAEWYKLELKRPAITDPKDIDTIIDKLPLFYCNSVNTPLNRIWNTDKMSALSYFEWKWFPKDIILSQYLP